MKIKFVTGCLKKLPLNFKKVILLFFNKSLTYSKIPDICKQSTIKMIPKKDDSSLLKKYMPISRTLCLNKLLEKLVLNRLNIILENNKTIIKQQSGFRYNCQTKDNLVFITQKILETFGNRKKILIIRKYVYTFYVYTDNQKILNI